ncbi:MAG: pyridoxamine 5'-phosphate oxidase family protein [Acholeplasmatales bacterium]|nr:pyridoxamine 5'-phosphate oxidase family protein [Acholeplasmatales bacterium]
MNKNLERILSFLDETQVYYLATVEGDQPRVRPFGTAIVYNNKLFIQTGKIKPVSHQLANNPKAEICAFKDGKWLRVSGELVEDKNREIKTLMLEKMPSLRGMYNEDDGNMQMLYFKNATATFSSFTAPSESFEI